MCAHLAASSVSFAYGPNIVVNDVSFTLSPDDRLGLVGPNGSGKSTLLRLVAGELTPDSGQITVGPAGTTTTLFRQVVDGGELDVLSWLQQRSGVAAIEAEFEEATRELAEGTPTASQRYDLALERLVQADPAQFPVRVGRALSGAGLESVALSQRVDALSGGQRTRLQLAALDLVQADVLLLDEPTNDLDADGLAILERIISDRTGPLLVVSHDRTFLSNVVTGVLELDDHTRSVTRYDGGFEAWEKLRSTAQRHAEENWKEWSDTRDQLRSRATQQRQWSKHGVAKHKRSGEPDRALRQAKIERSEQGAAKATRAERELHRHEAQRVDKPWEGWELRLEFAEVPTAGREVARVDAVTCRRGDFVLGPIDAVLSSGDRVLLTGPNGAGKTTFINVLFGQLKPDSGTAHVGRGTVVGTMSQGREQFGAGQLIEEFVERSGLDDSAARSQLAKFGLDVEAVERPAAALSPGERTRAVLGLFAAKGVNTLVLDEPTNHLDLEAIEQIEIALERFEGTVLLVTHDRRFADRFAATRWWHIEAGQFEER